MSLNGLDDPKVKEAHEAAVAEPGGWFLLKYASRDEVELLGRGNGGIVEVRNNVAQYEDQSPLYGFLRYRRRNVIIRYLPEECSRLVQARVTVHFTSICERFAPYDTTFSIATAKELKDTKLSAACSLHTASGSTSSSTSSLRRRRLMEIAEEEEEEQRAKRQSIVKEEEGSKSTIGAEDSTVTSNSASSPPSAPPVTLNSELAISPEHSQFSGGREPPTFNGVPRPPSPAKSLDAPRRNSSQSTRPDLYSYSSYPYGKAKVKLGPRPSLDVSGRPRTAGGYRPISTIPAGFKIFSKGSKKGQTQDRPHGPADSPIKEEAAEITFLASSIPIPEDPSLNPGPLRPTTSSGVSTQSAMTTLSHTTTKQNAMTPEKARLIKAMQLREKKKKLSMMPIPTIETPSAPSTPASPEHAETPETIPEETEQSEDLLKGEGDPEKRRSMSNADSAIAIEGSNDQASVDTRSDSHPPSPIVASSEVGDSTKASSLSESTDETIQAGHEQKAFEVGADDNILDSTAEVPSSLPDLRLTRGHGHQSEMPFDVEDGTQGEAELDSPRYEEHALPKMDETAESTPVEARKLEVSPEGLEEVPSPQAAVEQDEASRVRAEKADGSEENAEQIVQTSPAAITALPISKFSSMSPTIKKMQEVAFSEASRATEEVLSTHPAATTTEISGTRTNIIEEESASPQYKIPVSKFSKAHDSTPPTGSIKIVVPPVVAPAAETTELADEQEAVEADGAPVDDRRARRKAVIEPIRTDIQSLERDTARSDANLSDDDDLLDELQTATVEEAKPVTVSKSPMTPVFPSMNTPKQVATGGQKTPRVVRTVSNPIRGPLLVPGDVSQSSARTVSSGAAFLHKITQQQSSTNLAPKPGKIGSSISQRIKALEKLSGSAVGGSDVPARADRPSSTFFSVRKTSVREPSRSPSVVERTNSLSRGQTPSPPQSRESSPETAKASRRDRSGSMASRLSIFEGGSAPRGRPESIQVTARIVRDPTQPFPKMPEPRSDPTEFSTLDLKQSPLVVDHQKATPAPNPAPSPAVADAPSPATTAAPAPVVALGPGPEESQLDLDRKPRESLLQRRLSKDKRRSQSQDRASQIAADDVRSVEEGNRPRRRSSLSVVKDFIKERRNSLRARSPSTDNLQLSLSPSSVAPQTPSRSPSRPPSVHQNTSYPQRLSIGSRRSSMSRDAPLTGGLSPSLMTEASNSGEEGKAADGPGDKKSKSRAGSASESSKNRASRFIRRLSSSLGGSRKNAPPTISPTVTEEDAAEMEAITIPSSRGSAATQLPSIVAFLGDVNVQFPDNLLWKRRTMCLDSQGFLILSAVQGVAAAPGGRDKHGGAIKRYHLSDFRQPYTPEMEVQELPNSVVLDFVDGSGLQIACEDRAGQLNVLHVLQDAHQSHTSFGQ